MPFRTNYKSLNATAATLLEHVGSRTLYAVDVRKRVALNSLPVGMYSVARPKSDT